MSDQILGPGGGSPPQKYRVEAEPDPAAARPAILSREPGKI